MREEMRLVEPNQAASFFHRRTAQGNHPTTAIPFLFATPDAWPDVYLVLSLFELVSSISQPAQTALVTQNLVELLISGFYSSRRSCCHCG